VVVPSLPTEAAEKAAAAKRKRLARVSKGVVEEGRPSLAMFEATPKSSRKKCLENLVQSSNISGKGCCPKHIAWMAVYWLVADELLSQCGHIELHSDWQCPVCFGLNRFASSSVSAKARQLEQVCLVCKEVVSPVLAGEQVTLL